MIANLSHRRGMFLSVFPPTDHHMILSLPASPKNQKGGGRGGGFIYMIWVPIISCLGAPAAELKWLLKWLAQLSMDQLNKALLSELHLKHNLKPKAAQQQPGCGAVASTTFAQIMAAHVREKGTTLATPQPCLFGGNLSYIFNINWPEKITLRRSGEPGSERKSSDSPSPI